MVTWQVLTGDVREMLRTLPKKFVQCVVTSPPYWGLRDYKTVPTMWGGDASCQHKWDDVSRPGAVGGTGTASAKQNTNQGSTFQQQQQLCKKCGAWIGNLGLEPTPELFVAHLVEVFREVRRVLRDDGVVWLNLGDSYSRSSGPDTSRKNTGQQSTLESEGYDLRSHQAADGTKPKDLVGIPWMAAFALRVDGWYLRSDVIWAKPNPMPESVTDRPTKAHEYVFLLTKSPSYFYDAQAIANPYRDKDQKDEQYVGVATKDYGSALAQDPSETKRRVLASMANRVGSNARTVWTIATQSYKGAHFATFPEELPSRCIKAGSSETGACAKCGTPLERMIARVGKDGKTVITSALDRHAFDDDGHPIVGDQMLVTAAGARKTGKVRDEKIVTGFPSGAPRDTVGWEPSCDCAAGETVPCVVLDPFNGSGTTGQVAVRLGRSYVGIELNPQYVELARERIGGECPLFAKEIL